MIAGKKGQATSKAAGNTVSISQGTLLALNSIAAFCLIISERDKKVGTKDNCLLMPHLNCSVHRSKSESKSWLSLTLSTLGTHSNT